MADNILTFGTIGNIACYLLMLSSVASIAKALTDVQLLFDYFFRIGKKSTRLVNAAAVKLTEELFNMIDRPDYAMVTRVREGTETQIFKYKFVGWDEVIAVDFTRTAESVQKTGADLTKWAMQQETKAFNSSLHATPASDAAVRGPAADGGLE